MDWTTLVPSSEAGDLETAAAAQPRRQSEFGDVGLTVQLAAQPGWLDPLKGDRRRRKPRHVAGYHDRRTDQDLAKLSKTSNPPTSYLEYQGFQKRVYRELYVK